MHRGQRHRSRRVRQLVFELAVQLVILQRGLVQLILEQLFLAIVVQLVVELVVQLIFELQFVVQVVIFELQLVER